MDIILYIVKKWFIDLAKLFIHFNIAHHTNITIL